MNYEPYNWSEGEEISIERLQHIENGIRDLPMQEDLLFIEERGNKVSDPINFTKDSVGRLGVLEEGNFIEISSYFNPNQYFNASNLKLLLECLKNAIPF